jgi:hypothetical protein
LTYGELIQDSVCANFAATAAERKTSSKTTSLWAATNGSVGGEAQKKAKLK